MNFLNPTQTLKQNMWPNSCTQHGKCLNKHYCGQTLTQTKQATECMTFYTFCINVVPIKQLHEDIRNEK